VGEDPRRAGDRVVANPAPNRGVAVGGQRDGVALLGGSSRAGAEQLVSQLAPNIVAAGEDPRRPGIRVIAIPAHDGSVAVVGQGDRAALIGLTNRATSDQLVAPLGPNIAAARVDPHRPGAIGPTHDGCVAVGRQRDRDTLLGAHNRAVADQLAALLGPDIAATSIDPRRPGIRVVAMPAHDSGVAVGGHRDGAALLRVPNRAISDQLTALLVQTLPLRV
jgi:hypothetical protein